MKNENFTKVNRILGFFGGAKGGRGNELRCAIFERYFRRCLAEEYELSQSAKNLAELPRILCILVAAQNKRSSVRKCRKSFGEFVGENAGETLEEILNVCINGFCEVNARSTRRATYERL